MINLEYWDKLKTPPQGALKKIAAGRMKGKSDINPQWRIMIMTEVFGPVGIGWKYSIDKLWTEAGSDGQVCAFAIVSVCVKHEGEWSDPIQGSGGSMLIANELKGPFTSDEAFKMATTDALSVALKAFGVAADIYMGIFDGAKYPTDQPTPKPVRKLLSADWEKVFDLECDKDLTSIKAWRTRRGAEIRETIANTEEAKKLKGYLDSVEEEYVNPKTITCPENNTLVNLSDCKNSACSKDCPALAGA